MPPLEIEQRENLANRYNGGQQPKDIAAEMNISARTVYPLIKQFAADDGFLTAVAPRIKMSTSIDRDMLLDLSEMMQESPKITLQELRSQAISEVSLKVKTKHQILAQFTGRCGLWATSGSALGWMILGHLGV